LQGVDADYLSFGWAFSPIAFPGAVLPVFFCAKSG
jgi:hypothetical protein